MGLLASFVEIAFPRRCASCREWADGALCEACEERVARIRGPLCLRCGRPAPMDLDACGPCRAHPPAFRRARAAAVYAGSARDLLIAFKLTGERRAARAMAAMMVEAAASLEAEAICFVPSSARAMRARGFDPAEALARPVARALGLPVVRALRKCRETEDQAGLSREGRRDNLRGAFVAARAPGRVLLVDDVITTGATAGECAAALRAEGAAQVDLLTFARAL